MVSLPLVPIGAIFAKFRGLVAIADNPPMRASFEPEELSARPRGRCRSSSRLRRPPARRAARRTTTRIEAFPHRRGCILRSADGGVASSIHVALRVAAESVIHALPRRRRWHSATRKASVARVAQIFPVRRRGETGPRAAEEDGAVEAPIAFLHIVQREVHHGVLPGGIGPLVGRVRVDAAIVPVGAHVWRRHEAATDRGLSSERVWRREG